MVFCLATEESMQCTNSMRLHGLYMCVVMIVFKHSIEGVLMTRWIAVTVAIVLVPNATGTVLYMCMQLQMGLRHTPPWIPNLVLQCVCLTWLTDFQEYLGNLWNHAFVYVCLLNLVPSWKRPCPDKVRMRLFRVSRNM